MVFVAELDDLRQEVRQGDTSARVTYWPKVAGAGNVLIASATFEVIDRRGVVLFGSAAAVVETVDGISRVRCAVNAGGLELDEHFGVRVAFDFDGETIVKTVRFDCVKEPWDGSDISINDLIDAQADIGELIDSIVAAQAGSNRTREQVASVFAMRACSEVKRRIRALLEAKGRIYPRLIIQREDLNNVVRAKAVSLIYRSQGGGVDSVARQLADDWNKEAESALIDIGEMDYDGDEDGSPEEIIGGLGTMTMRRSWD